MVDVFVVLTVALFAVLGFYWGAIRQLLAVMGLLASLVVSGRFAFVIADVFEQYTLERPYAMLLAVLCIMVGVGGTTSVLASLIHQFFGLIALGWLDHLIGGLFGLLQAMVTLVAVMLMLAAFPHQDWVDALRSSIAVNTLVYVFGGVVLPFVPEPLQSSLSIVVYR